MTTTDNATQLLAAASAGDAGAADRLAPLVYAELRVLAANLFRAERRNHTLQPTAIVNDAFVRLIDQTGAEWRNRAHFFAVASIAMRNILTDYARRRATEKRGGGRERVNLEEASGQLDSGGVDVIALDEAMTALAQLDPRRHRIVELRFFGGLTTEEIADVLNLSTTTIESEWRGARAWLATKIGA